MLTSSPDTRIIILKCMDYGFHFVTSCVTCRININQVCVLCCVCVRVCVFFGREGGGTPIRHGHKESYTDLNLKSSTSEWDSNPRPREY